MSVCDRSHNRPDRKAVKVIIDEYEAAQKNCSQLCTDACFNMSGSPFTEGSGTAGLVHQGDHDAEEYQKYQNTYIVGV